MNSYECELQLILAVAGFVLQWNILLLQYLFLFSRDEIEMLNWNWCISRQCSHSNDCAGSQSWPPNIIWLKSGYKQISQILWYSNIRVRMYPCFLAITYMFYIQTIHSNITHLIHYHSLNLLHYSSFLQKKTCAHRPLAVLKHSYNTPATISLLQDANSSPYPSALNHSTLYQIHIVEISHEIF